MFEKMGYNFDFKKPEDQKRFNDLLLKEKRLSMNFRILSKKKRF